MPRKFNPVITRSSSRPSTQQSEPRAGSSATPMSVDSSSDIVAHPAVPQTNVGQQSAVPQAVSQANAREAEYEDLMHRLCTMMQERGISINVNGNANANGNPQHAGNGNGNTPQMGNPPGVSRDLFSVKPTDNNYDDFADGFDYEKFIKFRVTAAGNPQLFVKWKGRDSTYNSWISISDINWSNFKPKCSNMIAKKYAAISNNERLIIIELIKEFNKNKVTPISSHYVKNNKLYFKFDTIDLMADFSYELSFDDAVAQNHSKSIKAYVNEKGKLSNLIALYARVSSQNQVGDDHVSLDAQVAKMKSVMTKNGYTNLENVFYVQEVGSGRGKHQNDKVTTGQKKLELLSEILKNSEFLVYAVHRFSRNTMFGIKILARFSTNNVRFFSTLEGVGYDNDTSRNIVRSALSVAEQQSDATSSNVKLALSTKKIVPKHKTSSFGYRQVITPSGVYIKEIHPVEHNIVVDIVNWYTNEVCTYDDIADVLNTRKTFYRGRKWNARIVRNVLLQNYKGTPRSITDQIKHVRAVRKDIHEKRSRPVGTKPKILVRRK